MQGKVSLGRSEILQSSPQPTFRADPEDEDDEDEVSGKSSGTLGLFCLNETLLAGGVSILFQKIMKK